MLEKNKNITIIGCTAIATLCITYACMIGINFFTKEEVITKETIVGINPITSTKSSMLLQESLIAELEQQEKELQKEEENNRKEQEDTKKEVKVNSELSIVNNKEETKMEQVEEFFDTVPTEYRGFTTIGKIEIPQTGVNTPILNQVTVNGMENAPCLLYATGELNENGNNLIVGHNYRNGTLFSNNKNLKLGDKIYITTLDGKRVEYTIYDKFVTTAEDVSYIKRDTSNKPEITLSCCTDDDEYRIVILAKN